MKVSTILIIAILGAIAFLLLHPSDTGKKPAEVKAGAETAAPPPSSEPPSPPTQPNQPVLQTQPALPPQQTRRTQQVQSKPPIVVPKAGLMVVRGTVSSISPDGMVIECGRRSLMLGTSLDDPKIKKDVVEKDMNDWGPLLIAQDENVHRMEWEPSTKATGRLFLKNHPFQFQSRAGDHVNIVAVPLPETYSANSGQIPVYTMRFTVEAGAKGPGDNWMWQKQKQGSMLDH